jgi:hypothetical protein
MDKNKLIDIINKLLKTDTDLGYLKRLTTAELKALIACMRDRIEHNL